jgi:predicted nucleic acid-binding protein
VIVVDANVLIALLDREDAHHRAAVELLERHVAERMVAHPLSIAEALVRPATRDRLAQAAGALDAMGIERVAEADDPRHLAALRAGARLTMPDCCALLVAVRDRTALATFDRRLAAAAAERGVRVLGLDPPVASGPGIP